MRGSLGRARGLSSALWAGRGRLARRLAGRARRFGRTRNPALKGWAIFKRTRDPARFRGASASPCVSKAALKAAALHDDSMPPAVLRHS